MNPFAIKFDSNILHAQAFGTWFYFQIGEFGLFLGRGMPKGLRFVWTKMVPRITVQRHGKKR